MSSTLVVAVAAAACSPRDSEPSNPPNDTPMLDADGQGEPTGPTLVVPAGGSPTLDGQLDDEAWQGAIEESAGDDVGVRFVHDGKYLYIGVDWTPGAISHVCVSDGSRVIVLHASASLGTAEWTFDGEWWKRKREFAWVARDADDADKRTAERDTNLQAEAWTGTTVAMGKSGHTEYQLNVAKLGGKHLRLAVLGFGEQTAIWPTSVKDSCGESQLASGQPPETAGFLPDEWALVRLAE